jgi:hypothetical protein
MRNLMFATLAATVLASSVGCCCGSQGMFQPWGCSGGGCSSCGGCGSGGWGGGWGWGGGGGGGGCGCSSCGSGCSSCGSGSCGCSDGGYSSRFGNSDGYAYNNAARYSNGAPPSGYGTPWLSNGGGATCNHCPNGPGFGLGGPCAGKKRGPQGPPMTANQYPYYANRGPRDFLAKYPPSIGP